jgi:hypothetical protein
VACSHARTEARSLNRPLVDSPPPDRYALDTLEAPE